MNVDSMISRKLPIGIQNFEKLHTEGYFSNLTSCRTSAFIRLILPCANGQTYEETMEKFTRRYDGYHFNYRNWEGMFNPFSVLNMLSTGRKRYTILVRQAGVYPQKQI